MTYDRLDELHLDFSTNFTGRKKDVDWTKAPRTPAPLRICLVQACKDAISTRATGPGSRFVKVRYGACRARAVGEGLSCRKTPPLADFN
jgi:hypothetical protein